MVEDDKQRFAQMMAGLGVAFDAEVSKERMTVYFESLRDLPVETVLSAGKEAIKTLNFFPKVAEIRALAKASPEMARHVKAMASNASDKRLMIENRTPPGEVKKRLSEIAKTLNSKFGTSFAVDECRGRPEFVTPGRKNVS